MDESVAVTKNSNAKRLGDHPILRRSIMKTTYKKMLSFISLLLLAVFINYCQHETPMQQNQPCIDNQPVEDTTRVYFWPESRDTLRIYPKMIFARFYPWVTEKDTTKIKQLAAKYHLRLWGPPSVQDQQLTARLCVTDNRRAEYHFTPYGKTGFCNFGADSLVEYAFGVFNDGWVTPFGQIVFKFTEDTPQTRIDSLFEANGLRFLHTSPDFPSGTRYWTVVTPRAPKNMLDLAYDLRFVPFAIYVGAGIGVPGIGLPPRCE
jgi:hypothetical protein